MTRSSTVPPVRLRTLGNVYDFTKEDQSIRVRQGTIVDVLLTRNAEGVWHDEANGWLGVCLCVYAQYFGPGTLDETTWESDWMPRLFMGCDGVSALRRGPRIGRVHDPIHVPVPIHYSGAFLLKTLVIS